MKKISKFNIRNTFDKLQNNVQNQKTVDLINTLQKKILNEESNYGRGLSSSTHEPSKKNINNNISNKNDLASFKTVNFGARNVINFGSSISKNNEINHMPSIQENTKENTGMTKFFQKIKNNLDRSISRNEKRSDKNIIKEEESSSSDDDDEDNNDISNDNSNDLISRKTGKNEFAKKYQEKQEKMNLRKISKNKELYLKIK